MLAWLGAAVVVVRVYDVSGMADVDRRHALDVAQRALAAASVQVIFKDCGSNGPNVAPCDTPPLEGERIVRILHAPAHTPAGTGGALGSAIVDKGTGKGVLATVYADRIEVVSRGRIDRRLLLGRVVAHELGHLLLGVKEHSRSGLMREFWSDEQVRKNRSTDWEFSPTDRQRMRRNLLAAQAPAGLSPGLPGPGEVHGY